MSALFRINDTTVNKISYYHLLLLMASLPFDMFYSHVILISYAVHTLINLNKAAVKRLANPQVLVLQSVYFVTLFSTIYTINLHEGIQDWGKLIIIFLIPPLFIINPFDIRKYRGQLLLGFVTACTAAISYLFADALITIRHYHLPLKALFSSAFTNHNFSEPIGIHATFFSMQAVVALVYLLSVLTKKQSGYQKLFYLLCCAVLFAGIIQLSSKSAFIVLILAINVVLPYFLLKGKYRLRLIAFSASITVFIAVAIIASGHFRERYVTSLKDDLSRSVATQTTDTRLARWKVTLGLIKKAPVIGYGAGSEIGLLQDGFYNHKLYSSFLNRLNTHSQYLSFLLKSGLVGLLVYLATLVFGFRLAFRNKDALFFTFMLLIAVVSMSENLLDVDKGIIFYAFFFSFFTFSIPARRVDNGFKKSAKYFQTEATKQLVEA